MFKRLIAAHILIICASNILVQYPIAMGKIHTTWGAIFYPIIFVLTDLTTRLAGPKNARKIVFSATVPALIISFLVSTWLRHESFAYLNLVAFRITFASLVAYAVGQLLDIFCFQSLRQQQWWYAPAISTLVANIFDTYLFFSVAFYHSRDFFMATHWVEIANADLICKILISFASVVPLYGLILNTFLRERVKQVVT